MGRREAPLTSVAAAAPPGSVLPLQGDIAKEEVREINLKHHLLSQDIERISAAIPSEDQLCYLIQNAAVGQPGRLLDLRREDFEQALAVNVTAPLFLTQVG